MSDLLKGGGEMSRLIERGAVGGGTSKVAARPALPGFGCSVEFQPTLLVELPSLIVVLDRPTSTVF